MGHPVGRGVRRSRSDQQIVREGNALARLFYKSMGYVVPDGYRFDQATHPQEVGCWKMAVLAYDHIEQTDLQAAADAEED